MRGRDSDSRREKRRPGIGDRRHPRGLRMPDHIALRAIDQRWSLAVDPGVAQPPRAIERENHTLELCGRMSHDLAWQPPLRQWVMSKGRAHLTPWLERLAASHDVRFARVRIGCQRTRWGSYSTRGTVSLNAGLLFLPHELVRYVLLHELCHVAVPCHSAQFWALLEEREPEARRLRRTLREAHPLVPAWLYIPPRRVGPLPPGGCATRVEDTVAARRAACRSSGSAPCGTP